MTGIGQEMRQQAALAGGDFPRPPLPPLPPCTKPGCELCAYGRAAAEAEIAAIATAREEVVTEMGKYLFDQIKAYPQIAETIACNLIAQLVRVGKQPDMPGAIRVLIDVTGDVDAAMNPTPADPPSPPATTPPAAMSLPLRGRWGVLHRATVAVLAAACGLVGLANLWILWVQR